MRVGYARVSSQDQRLDVQVEQLTDAGCEKIYQEKASGRTAQRLQLQDMLLWVREGDVVVVTRLDRLARSIEDLCAIARKLTAKNVGLKVLHQDVDTTTSTGKLMFGLLGIVAEFEANIRAERQREGINNARKRGVHLGRRKAISPELAERLRQDRQAGKLVRELAAIYGMSIPTVYRYLGESTSSSDGDVPISIVEDIDTESDAQERDHAHARD